MTTARNNTHIGKTHIGERKTVTARQHMRELGVAALPICGDDLHEMMTDRGIVSAES